jgi:catechol-2,3-dioxygenase
MVSVPLALLVAFGGLQSPPTPQPIGRLANVVVSTTRFKEMREFYETVIGLSPFYQDPTSCFYKAGAVNLVLVRLKGHARRPMEKVCLDFGVPSVEATANRLEGLKVRIESNTKTLIKFRDPDGNLIEIVKG